MPDPLNAVVIGYGYAGRAFHSYLINLEKRIRLYGVVSSDPEKRARIPGERGCPAFESVDNILADPKVDLVVLATPNDLHAPLAIRALEAGKHVVTDKPMCLDESECAAMIRAAETAGKTLSVFQNRRWDGDFLTLRNLLAEGRLGDLRWLELAWQLPRPTRGWRSRPEKGGGRLFDLGSHMIDQALLLIASPVASVYCRMHYDLPDHPDETHASVVLGFANGATAVIDTGGMHPLPKPRFHAFGTRGAFRKAGIDPQEKFMREERILESVEDPADFGTWSDGQSTTTIPTLPGSWTRYYAMIADTLLKGTPPPDAITLDQARAVIRVLDAARVSARDNRVVTFG